MQIIYISEFNPKLSPRGKKLYTASERLSATVKDTIQWDEFLGHSRLHGFLSVRLTGCHRLPSVAYLNKIPGRPKKKWRAQLRKKMLDRSWGQDNLWHHLYRLDYFVGSQQRYLFLVLLQDEPTVFFQIHYNTVGLFSKSLWSCSSWYLKIKSDLWQQTVGIITKAFGKLESPLE